MRSKWLVLFEICTVILAILVCLPQFHFVVTLLKSLAIQIGLGFFFMALLALITQRKRTAVVMLSVSVIFLFQTHFWEWNKQEFKEVKASSDVKIGHLNVLKFNRSHLEVIENIQEDFKEYDILSFQEVDNHWNTDLLTAFEESHPYIISEPRENCYGLLVMSKLPIMDDEVIAVQHIPYIKAKFSLGSNETIDGIFMHTRAPMSQKKHLLRNKQMESLQQYTDSVDFIVGDFNAVPWDEHILRLKMELGVEDARNGFSGTFPSYSPFKIPIDFIFYSKNWKCTNFQILDALSSDHKAITASFNKSYKK